MTSEKRTIRVERARQIFLKRGGVGGFAKMFEDFPSEIQQTLRSEAAVNDDEVPIIACYKCPESFVCLTGVLP